MSEWYFRISRENNFDSIPDFISYYLDEFENSRGDSSLTGNIEQANQKLPGQVMKCWVQLQDIESVLEYLNIMRRRLVIGKLKHFMTAVDQKSNRIEASKWSEGDPEVVNLDIVINDVAFIRNKWLGLHQALQGKSFAITNIVRLRVAGLEDEQLYTPR